MAFAQSMGGLGVANVTHRAIADPDSLWASAAEPAREQRVFRTAKILRLEYGKLKRLADALKEVAERAREEPVAAGLPRVVDTSGRKIGMPDRPGRATRQAASPVERHHGLGVGRIQPGHVGVQMIQVAPQMRILVAIEAVDLRKGIDGLAQQCREKLEFRFILRTSIYLLWLACAAIQLLGWQLAGRSRRRLPNQLLRKVDEITDLVLLNQTVRAYARLQQANISNETCSSSGSNQPSITCLVSSNGSVRLDHRLFREPPDFGIAISPRNGPRPVGCCSRPCHLRRSFFFVRGRSNLFGVHQADILGAQRAEEYSTNPIAAGGIQLPRRDLRVVGIEHHNRIVPVDLLSELIATGRSRLLDHESLQTPSSKSFLFAYLFNHHDLAIFYILKARPLEDNGVSIINIPEYH